MADINRLYNNIKELAGDKIDVGTPEQFTKALQSPDTAKRVYGNLSTVLTADQIGSENDFLSFVSPIPMARPQEKNYAITPEIKMDKPVATQKPLSPKEANQVIYGQMPGTTKIGDVSILPIGKNYQQQASQIEQPEVTVPSNSVNSDLKPLKVETIVDQPEQNGEYMDILSSKPQETGFMSTGAGDAIEKFEAGAIDMFGNTFGAINNFPSMVLGLPTPEKTEVQIAANEVAEYVRRKADRYKGKDFKQIWKDGDELGAAGDIALAGAESLPGSLLAMFGGGAGLLTTGASAMTQQYDKLRNNKTMSEDSKRINSMLNGTIQVASEFLGDVPIGNMLKGIATRTSAKAVGEAVGQGLKGWIGQSVKKAGLLFPPVGEGLEEVAAQIGTNITDYITGARKDWNPFDGAFEAGVYGMGAGAGFSVAGGGMQVAQNVQSKKEFKQADTSMTAMLSRNGYTKQEAEEIKQSLLTAKPEDRNKIVVAISGVMPDAIKQVDGKTQFNSEISNVFTNFFVSADNLQATSGKFDKQVQAETLSQEQQSQSILQQQKDEAAQQLAGMANNTTGTIQTVRLKDQSEIQLIGDSNVSFDELGNVDIENSSEMLYYRDQEGNVQVLSPENIDKFVGEKLLDQAQAEASEQIDQVAIQDEIDNFYPTEAEEWRDSNVVTFPDAESGNIMAQQIDDNGFEVDSPYPITDEEYAQISGKQLPIAVQDQQAEQTQEPVTEETSIPAYPVLEDGTPDIDKMNDQQFFDYRKETKGEQDAVEATKRQIKRTQASIQANDKAMRTLQDNWYKRLGKANSMQEEAKIEAKLEAEKAKIETERISLDEKINSLNSLIPTQNIEVDQVRELVNDESDIDLQVADNQNIDPRDNVVIDEVQETPESQDQFVQPNEMVEVREKPKRNTVDPFTRRMNDLGDYNSIEDYILRSVAGGMKFSWNGKEATKGLGEELGFHNSKDEKDWRKSILSNDGVTPQQLANYIWDEYGEDRNEGRIPSMGDYQDVYNAVLETVGSVQNATGALEKAEHNRMLLENKMSEEQYAEYMEAPESATETYILDNISDDILASFLGFSNFTPEQLDTLNQFVDNWDEQITNDYEAEQTAIEPEHRTDTGTEGTSPETSPEINAQSESISENEGQTERVVYKNGDAVTYQGKQYIVNGVTTDGQFYDLDNTEGDNVHEDVPASELSTPTVTEQISVQHIEENPTEDQKETGDYDKAHVSYFGMPITVENAKGSVRSGKDENGKVWSNQMYAHYGEFDGTSGYDGDPIDCFIGDNEDSKKIFVVDQINPKTGEFDESKVMLGYTSPLLAKHGYMKNYEKNWKGFKAITETTLEHFQNWLYDGAKQRKPFFSYVDTPKPTIIEPHAQQTKLQQLAEKYNNEVYSVAKSHIAGEILFDLKNRFGLKNQTIIVDGKEHFLSAVKEVLSESDYKDFEQYVKAGGVHAIRFGDKIWIDSSMEKTFSDLVSTWLHEQTHIATSKAFTKPELEILYNYVPNIEQFIPVGYEQESKSEKMNEVISFATEQILKGTDITDIQRGNVNLSEFPIQLQHALSKSLNILTNGKIGIIGQQEFDNSGRNTTTSENVSGTEKGVSQSNNDGTDQIAEQNPGIETAEQKARREKKEALFAKAKERINKNNPQYKRDGEVDYKRIQIDPELNSIALDLSEMIFEDGDVKFHDYARQMIEGVGEEVKPYLKGFYELTRYTPGMEGVENMSTPEEVASYDLENIKPEPPKPTKKKSNTTKPKQTQSEDGQTSLFGSETDNQKEKLTTGSIADSKDDVSLQDDNITKEQNTSNNTNDGKSSLLQSNSNRLPESEPQESAQGTDGIRGTGRGGELQNRTVSESNGTEQQSTGRKRTVLSGNADVLEPALVEFNAEDNDTNSFNPTRKYADNIATLETLNTLVKENRKATAQEKEILSKYVGFGGLKDILLNPELANGWGTSNEKYRQQVKRIIELSKEFDGLTSKSDSLGSIRGSILNAHFTSSSMIKAIYQGIDKLGFKGGTVLEPSAGTGNFITYMPNKIKSKSRITAVELDNLTGTVLKYLHDDVTVRVSGIQDANIPNNSQDLIISNVPFGAYKVFDRSFNGEKAEFQNRIHNYFFAKSIDMAREGGIIAFVTSKGVLDAKGNESLRKYLSNNAEFLGAVRLPNNAFKKNANTEVVTDIIFLKKNTTGVKNNYDFINTKEVEATHKDGEQQMVTVNNYFVQHPENMLGEIVAGGLYSRDDYTVVERKGQKTDIAKALKSMLPESVYQKTTSAIGLQANDSQELIDSVKEGNIEHINGRLVQKQEGILVDVSINEPIAKIEAYIKLRNQLMNLIYSEYLGKQDNELDLNREQLNIEYDNFVKKYGKLEKSIVKIAKLDADGYNVLSLENKGQKADIFSKRTIQPIQSKNHAENINEAIVISLYENANVDIERIAELLSITVPEAIEQAKGLIFEEPTGGFSTRDEYLSGNVKSKLKQAQKAVSEGYSNFTQNVEELTAVIPADIPALSIEARLGTRWIPSEVYTEFAQHLFNSKNAKIVYTRSTDDYSSSGRVDTVEATTKYGTNRRNGMDILVDALLINPPKIFDTVRDLGQDKRVLNVDETAKAVEKYEDIRSQFEDWVYKTDDRRTLLSGIYNEKYNTTVERTYNGDHLNIAGINGVELRKHQKDAIWMLLQNNGGIIDHLVGAGKTYVMVAGTMEMRRTGIAKKPMIIALKSTIPQIVESYRQAYPMAKILAPAEKDFKKENRKKLFSQIANNEWDCIIMSHDNYGKIPHEDDIQKKFIEDEIDQINSERAELENAGEKQALKGLEIRIKNLEARLEKISSLDKDNSLTFQQMGIDHIMVDESQMFKNLSYVTKQRGVAGLSKPEGSKRAFNLYVGVRYLQDKYGEDKGTTFLSGTPISNSMVEMYLLLKYLRPNKMAELGFNSFDAWATTFASPSSDIEFTVTGDFKAKTRFREFINVPELSMLYREIADIRTDANLKLDKPTMKGGGYTAVPIQMNDEQVDYSQRLMEFARTKDGQHIGIVMTENKKSAAMLIATNLSSKMAIDMRMIDTSASYDANGKIAKCAENVARIYKETEDFKGTQLIFSDLGTPKNKTNRSSLLRDYMEDELGTNLDTLNEIFGDPNTGNYKFPSLTTVIDKLKSVLELSENEIEGMISDSESSAGGFNVYDELKKRLIENGVPEEQIAYIHDYNSQRAKEKLFKQVNSGEIRIVLGSTQKLGTGVNVQDRLSAIHHIDVPWTPASMEQRNGRGLRQGNWAAKKHLNNELPVFAYATERTLDAYKYSLLQMKQHFLNQVKSGNTEDRSITEASGDGEVGLAELAAITSGNTDILTKSKLEQKINKLKKSKRNFLGELYEAQKKIVSIKENIPVIEKNIEKTKQSIAYFDDNVQKDENGKIIVNDINGKVLKGEKKKPAERADYMKAAIEITNDKLSRVSAGKLTDLFSIGGIKVAGYRVDNENSYFEINKKLLSVTTPAGESYSTNFSETPHILFSNIQKTIDSLPNTLSLQESKLTKANKDIVSYQEIIDKGENWDKESELQSTVNELKEVTKRLEDTSKPTEVAPEEETVSYKRVTDDDTAPKPPVILSTDTAIDKIRKERDYYNALQEWQNGQIETVAQNNGESLSHSTISELNRSLNRINAKLWEGWADAAKPVKKFQEFLQSNGMVISDNDNYYMRFTQVPSRIEYRFNQFKEDTMEPFIAILKAMEKNGFSYDDITTYAKLKHADEYTEHVIREKIKERKWNDNRINLYNVQTTQSKDIVQKYWEEWAEKRILNLDDKNPEYKEKIKSINNLRDKNIDEVFADFAGKRAIEDRIGQKADDYIQNFEEKNGELIDKFWKQSKEVSHYALNEEVRGGMRTRESADGIKNMFEYYVPLKGHRDTTAEDLWDYSAEHGDFFFSAVIKGKGRKSESDDPFSVMESTVRSAIGAAEQNLLLQTVLRLAQADQTGSMSVSKTWFVKVGEDENGKPEYKVADEVPFTADDTQESYDEKVIAFNKKMLDLKEKGEAYQSGSNSEKLKLGVWIKPTNEREHEIIVKRNGESFTVRIHTSPRIAQSINGTNMRYYDGAFGKTLETIGTATRAMAGFKTLWRPAFILITNPLRDIHAGLNLAYIDEGAAFTGNVIKNFAHAVVALSKRSIGKSDLNNKYDKMLNDYLLNGGKTGISKIMEIKQIQVEIQKQLKTKSSPVKSVFSLYHTISDITENQMRLAVYITAMEKGYSSMKATSMAKEATLNFDRKGNGRNGLRELKSAVAFINVGFQALDNIYTKSTQNDKTKQRAAIAIAANVLSGALLVAGLNAALGKLYGDDEDKWLTEAAKLSSFERNANFLIWTPKGFIKIPLGQEFRMFHGLGMDMLMGINGKVSATETAVNLVKGLSSLVPYNPIESMVQRNSTNPVSALVGSIDVLTPFAELQENKNWLGSPITKENQSDEKPDYLKVRTNKRGDAYAPEVLVKFAKALDHATGGDGVKAGLIGFNPDIADHLLGGYFAGIYEQPLTIMEGLLSDKEGSLIKEFTPRALWKSADDIHASNSGLNEKFYEAKDEAKSTTYYINQYNKELKSLKGDLDNKQITPEEYASKKGDIDSKVKELENGNYYEIQGLQKTIDDLQKKLPELGKSEQVKTENIISDLKENVVNLQDGKEVKTDSYFEVEAKYNSKVKQAQEYKAKRALRIVDADPELDKLTRILYQRPPSGVAPHATTLHAKIEKLQKRMEDAKTPQEKSELENQAIKLINKLP
ncbi:MAG: DEAD/DEAH box helicase family protein [Paludibacter sp.]|nr:DEAD/DEAH box helicase family protein [Paludibacter sp.]